MTDDLDLRIIELRGEKLNYEDIASEVGLTVGQVRGRIGKLLTAGLIPRYPRAYRHDWKILGPKVQALVEQGETLNGAARALGIPVGTIGEYAVKAGLAAKTQKQRGHPAKEGLSIVGRPPLPPGHPVTLACIGMTADQFRSAAR